MKIRTAMVNPPGFAFRPMKLVEQKMGGEIGILMYKTPISSTIGWSSWNVFIPTRAIVEHWCERDMTVLNPGSTVTLEQE